MKKTLFIQIDNTPAPTIEAENDYIPLDCKQINDFCSFVGDALIGDLKDCNGTPLYRLINPAGRLLSDFEKVDKANYDLIIAQWLDVLSEILHKGVTQCDEQFTIRFPQQYTDWLLCNQNDYYVEIGKSLQAKDGKVSLDVEGISEDIISALHMKITRFLNKEKDEIEYIVFSNVRIGNYSCVVKQLKTVFEFYSFMPLGQWVEILREAHQQMIVNLEDYRAFWIDDFKIGLTKKSEVDELLSSYTYKWNNTKFEFNEDGILKKVEVYGGDEVNLFLAILCNNTNINSSELSYSDISSFLLSHKGFVQLWESVDSRGFGAVLHKDAATFLCDLQFVWDYDPNGLNRKDTLFRIIVELK